MRKTTSGAAGIGLNTTAKYTRDAHRAPPRVTAWAPLNYVPARRRRLKQLLKLCIEWLRTQERWNPEVAIILDAAARYRRAKVGSSHDDAHPDNSTLHTGKIYSFPLHLSRIVLLLLRQRRSAAAATWEPRSNTCEKQRAAPRALA